MIGYKMLPTSSTASKPLNKSIKRDSNATVTALNNRVHQILEKDSKFRIKKVKKPNRPMSARRSNTNRKLTKPVDDSKPFNEFILGQPIQSRKSYIKGIPKNHILNSTQPIGFARAIHYKAHSQDKGTSYMDQSHRISIRLILKPRYNDIDMHCVSLQTIDGDLS